MKGFIFAGFTFFIGFVLGIMYTVQAADNSALVKIISVLKGLI